LIEPTDPAWINAVLFAVSDAQLLLYTAARIAEGMGPHALIFSLRSTIVTCFNVYMVVMSILPRCFSRGEDVLMVLCSVKKL
jgi:hypothetical protein